MYNLNQNRNAKYGDHMEKRTGIGSSIRKALSTTLVLFAACTAVFAQAVGEQNAGTIRLGVMQGPTGFSSCMLGDSVHVDVYPSPNEAVARLAKGELDMAVLPANAAANIYNKGMDIKAVAVVGEGMLSVVGTDMDSKTLSVPGVGGTPDHMAQLLYGKYEADYSVTAPAQLAQLVIAQKTQLAILPQPFVSMVLRQNPSIEVFYDVQADWEELTGHSQYPMSILVVRGAYADENPLAVEFMKTSYRKTIESILADPEAAGEKIEGLGIMKAAMATPAIPQCALVYKDGERAKDEVKVYYETLLSLAPDAIGGAMPDERFWI